MSNAMISSTTIEVTNSLQKATRTCALFHPVFTFTALIRWFSATRSVATSFHSFLLSIHFLQTLLTSPSLVFFLFTQLVLMGPQFMPPDWTNFSRASSTRIQVTKSHTKRYRYLYLFFSPGTYFYSDFIW
jgi:hypothetical protein